jgi:coproporphyrinogen III oxidase
VDPQSPEIPAAHDPGATHFCARVVDELKSVQDQICAGLRELECQAGSSSDFREDAWKRPGGGGGRSRVLENGRVFERAGVNFSEVYGQLEDGFAQALPGRAPSFYATGVSLVLHPQNPFVPTVHANFRHIRQGERAWFGGGADLTPYYFDRQDKDSFHQVWRESCARHPEVADYDRFSQWCDRYFYLEHRGERRGVGGIFFDDLQVGGDELSRRDSTWEFVKDAAHSFLQAYVPIVARHHQRPYGEAQREWQEWRRGRYVEFNLVYDRGTIFGLRTKGRIESILMSMPPRVRWMYDRQVDPNSPEGELMAEVSKPPGAASAQERS